MGYVQRILNDSQLRKRMATMRFSPGRLVDIDTVECAFCKGSGLRDGTGYAKCQVCGGLGTVRVHPPVMTCVFCRGEGHQSWGPLTCPVCYGKGVVTVKEPIATCPECGGTGESINPRLYCMRCRGKGVISAPMYRGQAQFKKGLVYDN